MQKLLPVNLKVSYETEINDKSGSMRVKVHNPTDQLALFAPLNVIKNVKGEEVLPIFWDDNYFSLLPNETKELKATWSVEDMDGEKPVLEVDGWNIPKKRL